VAGDKTLGIGVRCAAAITSQVLAMKKQTAWLVVIIAAAAIAAILFIHYRKQEQTAEVAPQPPAVQPPPAASAPPIKHPIGEAGAPGETQPAPLPQLAESDDAARQALESGLGNNAVAQYIDSQDFIGHLVASVDALARSKVARQTIPLKSIPGRFLVKTSGDDIYIDAANEKRYAALVRLADTVDMKKLVTAYVRLYPLFQEAYRKLGYPSDYFNDRLIESIDELLAAPEIEGPIKLVRPKVLYQYADPDLEARSCGQKMMIRMGVHNEREIKAKLKQLRQELTGQGLH
jgi:hypothetical protein